jgi:hypothetical protein
MPTALVGGAARRTPAQGDGGRAGTGTLGYSKGTEKGYSKSGTQGRVPKKARKNGYAKIALLKKGTQKGVFKNRVLKHGITKGLFTNIHWRTCFGCVRQ